MGEKWLKIALNHLLEHPQTPTHSMAFKHNTGSWDLKNYARLILRYFGPKKRLLWPLLGCKTH